MKNKSAATMMTLFAIALLVDCAGVPKVSKPGLTEAKKCCKGGSY